MSDKETRQGIISQFRLHEKDTGSSQVQVALLTARITRLNEHLKVYSKDHGTRRGLMKLVGTRRRQLGYISKNDVEKYQEIIKKLGLRK
ncbi:MAG: 30S ribosomal protein S15 [Dehalococcoidia bacterium]|nr:30S ribosomal protein S15 [Dehalococcoidia bacterium]